MKLSELFEKVEGALELDAGAVSMESSSENIEDWDSLGHITILGMLDATSMTEIVQIMTDNGLLDQ
jgi:acyl carrier protein